MKIQRLRLIGPDAKILFGSRPRNVVDDIEVPGVDIRFVVEHGYYDVKIPGHRPIIVPLNAAVAEVFVEHSLEDEDERPQLRRSGGIKSLPVDHSRPETKEIGLSRVDGSDATERRLMAQFEGRNSNKITKGSKAPRLKQKVSRVAEPDETDETDE